MANLGDTKIGKEITPSYDMTHINVPSIPGHKNEKIAYVILDHDSTGLVENAFSNDMKLLHNTMKYKHTKNETENKKIENVVDKNEKVTNVELGHVEETLSDDKSRLNSLVYHKASECKHCEKWF